MHIFGIRKIEIDIDIKKLVKRMKYYLELDEIDAVLVVNEFDLLELDALLDVQLLFILKGALVEELLQLLVTIVDGELLEAVDLEVLETGNVEHTDE